MITLLITIIFSIYQQELRMVMEAVMMEVVVMVVVVGVGVVMVVLVVGCTDGDYQSIC